MRKIVVPTDFSENAFNALKFAAELFKYETSEIFLLHTYAEEVYEDETLANEKLEELKFATHEKALNNLELIEERLKDLSPNPRHRIKAIAAFGLLIDEVNELVNSENADVVVMGTRGKTNNSHLTFGSNTLQVIKYIQCPVLSIPQGYRFTNLSNILFPTDFMIPYNKRELKLVAETAKAYNAGIHMLYISRFPAESLRQKDNKSYLKEQLTMARTHFHRVEETERVPAIMKQIDDLNIDMLVMVNSRYTYLESLLFESTIDQISLHPRIPFLVLQNYHRYNQ